MNATAEKPRVRVPAGSYSSETGLRTSRGPRATSSSAPARDWGSGYMRSMQPMLRNWNPALREASEDVKSAWRLATARSIDTMHNSGFFAGAVDQAVGYAIGPDGLNLDAKPNGTALGWTADETNAWSRAVEERYAAYRRSKVSCDAQNRATAAQQLGQAYKHWMATGEILATLPYFKRAGAVWDTKLRIMPAWRLSSRSEDTSGLVQGVRINRTTGEPVAYLFCQPRYSGGVEEVEVAAKDAFGRQLVVHIFDGEPDTVRGISPLTPALKVTRQFDQLMDATLTTTLIQTVFAAMFKSAANPAEVLAAMQSESEQQQNFAQLVEEKANWYQQTDINLGVHGKILHGFPGDELQFFRAEHPNEVAMEFGKFLVLEWSRVTALTYEEFSGDFSQATYSSIQMGTAANWPRVLWRRRHIIAPLEQARYEAWLEEDIEKGGTPFPGGVAGFLANREFAATAQWRGPTKPRADDLKTAKAALTWKEVGVPDAVIFDELGLDVDEVYDQRKREQDRKKVLGIEGPKPQPTGFGAPGEGDEKEDGEDENGRS